MSSFEAIRKKVLVNNLFSEKTGTFTITGENKMEVQFDASLPVWFIERLDTRFQGLFDKILACRQCADIAIWKRDNQNCWTLHIIEIKKTVDTSSDSQRGWQHIKKQFLGALLRCRMLAGIANVHFDRVFFYTAFVNDHITPRPKPKTEEYDTEDTTFYRVLDDTLPPWLEWETGRCHLDGVDLPDGYIEMAYTHRQIPLESQTLVSKDTVRL